MQNEVCKSGYNFGLMWNYRSINEKKSNSQLTNERICALFTVKQTLSYICARHTNVWTEITMPVVTRVAGRIDQRVRAELTGPNSPWAEFTCIRWASCLRTLATRIGASGTTSPSTCYHPHNMAEAKERLPSGKRRLVSSSDCGDSKNVSNSTMCSRVNLEECRADKSHRLTVEQKPSSIPKRR